MNARSLLLSLLMSTSLCAGAMSRTEADTLVASGQRAYVTGDPQAALDAFDSVATQFNSAALQLNMGNCWFKLGDVAHAILHYERGLRLAPGDADLQANLDLANEQLRDRVTTVPGLALGRWWNDFRGGSDPDTWARRSLYACLLFFALLTVAAIARKQLIKRMSWALSAVALVFLILCVSLGFARHGELTGHNEAIVLVAKTDAVGEPALGSKVLFVLHRGIKVEVRQQVNGWTEITLANGKVGWLPPGTLEVI